MSSRWDYFTYWNAVCTAIGYVILALVRLRKKPAPILATYLVCSSLVVCILGSWLLAFRMKIPKRFHRSVLRSQLWLHVAPLVLSFFLVSMWRPLVGGYASPQDALLGVGVLAAIFSTWASTPVNGHVWLDKIQDVYQTDESLIMLLIGVAIAATSGIVCTLRTHVA